MSSDPQCLFCRIASGDVPSRKVLDEEDLMAFEDINPQAPVHVLVIPKEHIPTIAEVPPERLGLVGRLVDAANRIAAEKRLTGGYRLVFNCRRDAGQEVFHLHLHLLGGRRFGWPPG